MTTWRERPPLTRLRNIATEIAEGAYRGPDGYRWPMDPSPSADAARTPYDGLRPLHTINQLVDELLAVHHDLTKDREHTVEVIEHVLTNELQNIRSLFLTDDPDTRPARQLATSITQMIMHELERSS